MAAEMTLKKWKVKNVQEQGNLETSDCGAPGSSLCFWQESLENWTTGKWLRKLLLRKEKHVPHQAEVVGKEWLSDSRRMGPINRTQQPRGSKQRGWPEGREPAAISTSEAPGLASPGVPGRGRLGRTRGLWHPSTIQQMRKLTQQQWVPSSGGWARFVQNKGERAESQPGGCCCYTYNKQHGAVDRQPAWEVIYLGPVSDSATHRWPRTCPATPWGPAAPLYDEQPWPSRGTSLLSFELHSEGTWPALELWQMTLNSPNRRDGAATLKNHKTWTVSPSGEPTWTTGLFTKAEASPSSLGSGVTELLFNLIHENSNMNFLT